MKIAVFDYKSGNIYSVLSAFRRLGYEDVKLTNNEREIMAADVCILPGVGAFPHCMSEFSAASGPEIVRRFISFNDKKLIGICVGMQMLGSYSSEMGMTLGLNLIPGSVSSFNTSKEVNVGWSEVSFHERKHWNSYYYFDHSFYFSPENSETILCESLFGNQKFCSGVFKDNIYGLQFHPEKSDFDGLILLDKIIRNE